MIPLAWSDRESWPGQQDPGVPAAVLRLRAGGTTEGAFEDVVTQFHHLCNERAVQGPSWFHPSCLWSWWRPSMANRRCHSFRNPAWEPHLPAVPRRQSGSMEPNRCCRRARLNPCPGCDCFTKSPERKDGLSFPGGNSGSDGTCLVTKASDITTKTTMPILLMIAGDT